MNDDPAAEAAEQAMHDKLVEVAWQAWLANGISAKAGVADAVDAVEPIIRADLRAKVEGLPQYPDRWNAVWRADVLALFGGESDA